jgi:hypothetical protein
MLTFVKKGKEEIWMSQQSSQGLTTKELSYIADSLKNEELLTTLCVHGAVECQNQQLKNALAQLAHERFQQFDRLSGALEQMNVVQ